MANTKNITYDQLSTTLNKIKTYVDGQVTTLTNAIAGKANSVHTHATSDITSLNAYSKPSSTSALTTSDSLNAALGKLEKALDGKAATHNHPYLGSTATAVAAKKLETAVKINGVSFDGSSDITITAAPNAHNQASNTINAMTGYSKPSSTSAIATTDTLNAAIGKLEKALDGKQASGSYSTTGHTHDDRYYTESEINTKVSTLESSISSSLSTAKAYADQKVADLVDSAPGALNTLNELAAALGDDENFAATMTTNLASKSDKGHGHDAATTTANGFMTAAMVTKLNSIADNANAYSHPTSSGNKHVPSGGSSGQFLGWSADGTAAWVNNPNTDAKVKTTNSNTTKLYLTGCTSATTGNLQYDSGIYTTTTAGELVATTFTGALNGNASSATTAAACSGNAATATTADKTKSSLTISLNGTSQGAFNGSSAKSIDITPSSIGAATTAQAEKCTDAEITSLLTSIFGS